MVSSPDQWPPLAGYCHKSCPLSLPLDTGAPETLEQTRSHRSPECAPLPCKQQRRKAEINESHSEDMSTPHDGTNDLSYFNPDFNKARMLYALKICKASFWLIQ